VLDANDGLEALQKFRENADKIDLLITEIMMPCGMTGSELARQIWELRPNLEVVLMSGYSRSLLQGESNHVERLRFIPKPLDLSELLRVVRRSLAGRRRSPDEDPGPNGGIRQIEGAGGIAR